MSAVTLSLDDLHELASGILIAHNTSEINADQVADALVAAEADGQKGHGASRIPSYAAQSRSGKVDGHAAPTLEQISPSSVRIDASSGFAYPALNLAIERLGEMAPEHGIAAAAMAPDPAVAATAAGKHQHHDNEPGQQVAESFLEHQSAPTVSAPRIVPYACQISRPTFSLTNRTLPSPSRAVTPPACRLRAELWPSWGPEYTQGPG